jgi:hypothetical protein
MPAEVLRKSVSHSAHDCQVRSASPKLYTRDMGCGSKSHTSPAITSGHYPQWGFAAVALASPRSVEPHPLLRLAFLVQRSSHSNPDDCAHSSPSDNDQDNNPYSQPFVRRPAAPVHHSHNGSAPYLKKGLRGCLALNVDWTPSVIPTNTGSEHATSVANRNTRVPQTTSD